MGNLRPTPSRRSLPLALYVFAAVLVVRLFVLLRLTASPLLLPQQGDTHFYNDWALRILHGQWTDHQAFYGLPLYAYLLALLYKVAGYTPFVPAFLQACADSATAAILFKMVAHLLRAGEAHDELIASSGRIEFAERVGLLAAAVWAFYVPAQAYAAILMPTVLAVFVFWFVVAQVVERERSPQPLVTLLLGLLIGFSAMGVATTLFLVPLLTAALLIRWKLEEARQLIPRFILVVLLLTGVGVGMSPCWGHNYFAAHDPVFLSAHSGINFWIGNNPSATGYPRFDEVRAGQAEMLHDSVAIAERAEGKPLKRSEVSSFWSAKARAYIRGDIIGWVRLLGQKVWNFWNAYQYDDLSVVAKLRERSIILPGPRFGFLAALALAGMPFALRSFPRSRWILVAVLLQMAALLPVFVTERYRLAAAPGLVVLAILGLCSLWRSCILLRFRSVTVYLALLATSVSLVSRTPTDPQLWALDPYNAGLEALEAGDFVTAEAKLQLARSYVYDNPEVNLALGNLRLEQGDPNAARSFYDQAIECAPQHKAALNNRGVLELDAGAWQQAGEFFMRALHADPRDAKSHFLLAKAFMGAGEFRAAVTESEAATRLDSQQAEFRALRDMLLAQVQSH